MAWLCNILGSALCALCFICLVASQLLPWDDGDVTIACRVFQRQEMRGLKGTIRSPFGSNLNTYPKNSKCEWGFSTVGPNQFVSFRFMSMGIELTPGCNKDFVAIKKWNNAVRKYCGNDMPSKFTLSSGSSLSIEFRSDDMFEFSGFELEYEVLNVDSTCPGNYLRCRNDKCVPRSQMCDNVDQCGDGTDEQSCGFKRIDPDVCGYTPIPPVTGNGDRIIGGQEAIQGSWPWQVSLQVTGTYPEGHFCGGVLINTMWILTAGHCVANRGKTSFKLIFGKHHRWEKDPEEIVRYPNHICVNRDFSGVYLWNDIALVQLNAPVYYSDGIQPVCLPQKDEELQTGTLVHSTGWGSTFGTGHFDVLKQVMIPVMSWNTCNNYNLVLPLFKHSICTGYETGGFNTCFGDSGGPMVALKDKMWNLYGTVSWGPRSCGVKQHPAIFAKVSAYVNWIKQIMDDVEAGRVTNCRA
ncbi:chymotrypsinogen A-like [Tachypleus tridentatus]|uniref:chymotrypsinogen A-like n=1 Tax=Tachypleus tridentatus TaxID=6853 RepID=UPI003FCF5F30